MPQQTPLISVAGLNTDNLDGNIPQGSVTFAYNAVVSSFDRSYISYSSEGSNELCTNPKEGFRVIGRYNITEQQRVILFMVNPTTGESEIGQILNEGCTYEPIIWGDCLGFSLDRPIHQIAVKPTNCSTEIYWADPLMRWLNLDDLPWKEVPDPNNDYKKIKLEGQLDCNKLLVQADFSIPQVEIKNVEQGGTLTEGTYQFVVAYSNNLGETYTSFYNVTNPISIKEGDRATQNFDLKTSQAINVTVNGLDTTGLFDYFILVVIETINVISTPKLVGIYPIANERYDILYTGNTQTAIQLTPEQLFQRFQYYDLAEGVAQSDDRLIYYGVKEKQRIIYQNIWSQVKLNWETYKIPYNDFEGYTDPMNTYLYKGYMRDEVYPIEGVFILRNGKTTDKFHIPGRAANLYDREIIDIGNQDSIGTSQDPCEIAVSKERWQVYNTGTKIGFSQEYLGNEFNDCYKGPFEYGEFSFWESEERYPNNPIIWGDLANQKITHPKFPEELITPRFSIENGKEFIYPIGIKIDSASLYQAIQTSDLTQEEKDEIVGFKIIRGDRSSGNMSVRGKGLMFNVGKNTHNEQEFYFANYPYNDLRKDPYYVTDEGEADVKHGIKDHSGYRPDRSIDAFGEHSLSRFTWHCPDGHFGRIESVDTGILKLESIDSGASKGHFVQVKNNAKYKFLTSKMSYASLGVGVASGFTLAAGTFGWPEFDVSRVLPGYTQSEDTWRKLSPYTNFGYMFTSKADFLSSYPVPNEGYKIRGLNFGKYLVNGFNTVEDGFALNNKSRESSIYLNTINDFKFPHDYDVSIPNDTSRYTISSYGNFSTLDSFIPSGIPNITDEEISQAIGISDFVDGAGIYIFTATTAYACDAGDVYSGVGTTGNFTFNIVEVNGTLITGTVASGTGDFIPTTTTLTLISTIENPSESDPFITFTAAIKQNETLDQPTIQQVRDVLDTIQSIQDFQNLSSDGIEGIAADAILISFNKINGVVDPESFRTSNVSAYYASLKSYLPSQWGRIYSYTTVDTGHYQSLLDATGNPFPQFPTVFGGDTFINKFSLKRKISLFDQTTFNAPDDADINYKKQGNLGYPMYWLSTEYEDFEIDIQPEVDKIIEKVDDAPGSGSGGSFFSKLWSVISGILSGGFSNVTPIMFAMVGILRKLFLKLGRKNINLDNASSNGIIEQGLMYMYVYGIPTFFVESQINIDYRQATNDNEGNFYPRVGQEVPDDWLQQERVDIQNDNNYTYNKTYSKQNRENFYSALREDFDPDKLCYTEFPNRAIWSEKSNLSETFNNWLIFKPVSRFDFPKSYGNLTSLDGIANGAVLARFENKTQVYNALTTIDTSTFQAYLGNANLFSTRPQDFSETDGGALGSQHKFLLKISEGIIYVDAKRGQVVLYRGESPQVISDQGNSRWFSENLPFKIYKKFPSINIDNNFKDIGITGVYDEENKRILITKKDYEVLNPQVNYLDGKFYLNNQEIQLDSEHFCNKSWTISFSFLTNSWISYHSYQPNYYISYPNFFQSGIESGIWNHNTNFTKYHTFYDKIEPYILEYPLVYQSQQDQVIQSIRDYCTATIYQSRDISYESTDILYFNKFQVYNRNQHTGTRNLIPKPQNNLAVLRQYPKYNTDSIDVLVDKKDSWLSFNGIWDSIKEYNKPFLQSTCSVIVDVDQENIDYSRKPYKNYLIRSKDARIRLILDDKNTFKLTSRLVLAQSEISNA